MNEKCKDNSFFLHELINKCTGLNVNVLNKIGSGRYGIVYLIDYKDSKNAAVKIIKNRITNKSIDEKMFIRESIDNEVEFNKYLSEFEISPKLYNYFYIENNDYIVQYIIMEAGDGNISGLVRSNIPKKIKNEIIEKSIEKLISKVYRANMYCLDIKPENIVYFLKTRDAKLIDFGIDYCKKEEIYEIFEKMNKKRYKEFFITFILIQYCLLLYIDAKFDSSILSPFYKYLKTWNENIEHIEEILKTVCNSEVGRIFNYYLVNDQKNSKSVEEAIKIIKLIFKQLNE